VKIRSTNPISAPIAEEIAKALGVLLIFWLLRAEFDNDETALWPGQFVDVSVQLYEQLDAIVIPSQAVQTGPDGQYVYVVGADMLAELRRIKVLRTDGERAIVASGLAKGERVVTRGQLRLGPKTRVQPGKPAPEAS